MDWEVKPIIIDLPLIKNENNYKEEEYISTDNAILVSDDSNSSDMEEFVVYPSIRQDLSLTTEFTNVIRSMIKSNAGGTFIKQEREDTLHEKGVTEEKFVMKDNYKSEFSESCINYLSEQNKQDKPQSQMQSFNNYKTNSNYSTNISPVIKYFHHHGSVNINKSNNGSDNNVKKKSSNQNAVIFSKMSSKIPKIVQSRNQFYKSIPLTKSVTMIPLISKHHTTYCDIENPNKVEAEIQDIVYTNHEQEKRFLQSTHRYDSFMYEMNVADKSCLTCNKNSGCKKGSYKMQTAGKYSERCACSKCVNFLDCPFLRNNEATSGVIPCHYCPFKTTHYHNWYCHNKSIHKNNLLICPFCDYNLQNKYKQYMRTHVEIVHLGYKPYSCHICTFSTGWKNYLKIHLAKHKGF